MSARRRRGGVSAASRIPGYALVIIVVVMLIVASVLWLVSGRKSQYTVLFTNSTGLYVGDRVMVLGVPVGEVDEITPRADAVEVKVSMDEGRRIPADAKAAIVAPTLVTGRYVQFAPAYTGGPALAPGGTVPVDRTGTPVEFDQTKKQLVDLVKEVGPTSKDQQGALNRFIDATATTTDGNGRALHDALIHLSKATGTLNRGGDDLFTTVRNLQAFTTSLSTADREIRGFSAQLADFSGVLDDNRVEVDAVLQTLQDTFVDVKQLIDTNKAALAADVKKANTITTLLVDRIDTLANTLQVPPTAASDFYNIYDPIGNSLSGALGIPNIPDPKSLICALLTTVNAPEGQCATTVKQIGANAAAATAATGSRAGAPDANGLSGLLNPRGRGGHN